MKRILSVFLIGVLLASCLMTAAFAEGEITVIVNGEALVSDVPAQTIGVYDENGGYVGDRVMLPIRAISEKLNCDVFWNEDTSGITLYRKNNLYVMWVGEDTAFHLDGTSLSNGYTMDVPPTIVDVRTLVPVRAVAEILGAEVNWDEASNTVDIKYDLGEIENNAQVASQCAVYEILLNANYETYKGYVNGTIETVKGKFVLEGGEEIKFELYPAIAKETCENFISLAKSGFYDNTIFHRVIEGFVAQGGGFDTNDVHKDAPTVLGEFITNGVFNLIPHTRGTLSLARADDYNSGSSQFFIVHNDSLFLDGNYAGFGRVTEGIEFVDAICAAPTDAGDKPLTPIVLKQVIIEE